MAIHSRLNNTSIEIGGYTYSIESEIPELNELPHRPDIGDIAKEIGAQLRKAAEAYVNITYQEYLALRPTLEKKGYGITRADRDYNFKHTHKYDIGWYYIYPDFERLEAEEKERRENKDIFTHAGDLFNFIKQVSDKRQHMKKMNAKVDQEAREAAAKQNNKK